MLQFSSIEDISELVSNIRGSFLHPETMELIDARANQSLGQGSYFKLQEGEFLLLVGIAGSVEVIERHIGEIQTIAKVNNVKAFDILDGTEETKVWAGQQQINLQLTPGMVRGKAAIPINEIGNMLREIRKITAKHKMEAGITGHVGNGLLYITLSAENTHTHGSTILPVVADLAQFTDRLGGFFLMQNGPPEIRSTYDPVSRRSDYELMKDLKRSFDPRNIFNPGKVVSTL